MYQNDHVKSYQYMPRRTNTELTCDGQSLWMHVARPLQSTVSLRCSAPRIKFPHEGGSACDRLNRYRKECNGAHSEHDPAEKVAHRGATVLARWLHSGE